MAAPADRLSEVERLAPNGLELEVVEGGATRSRSVASALARVTSEFVAVHDAARPLVTPDLIDALVSRLEDDREAAGVIAAAPLNDTVKRVVRGKRRISRTERRDELWAAQTPQAFHTAVLRAAHAAPARGKATDDAMLVEQAGELVLVEPAPAWNIKVTTSADLRLAELLLATRAG